MAFLDNTFDFMSAGVMLRDSIAKNDLVGVQKALDNEADINAASTNIPYILMAAQKELWDMVKFLADNGAAIDAPNRYNWTVMHEAANKAPVDMTKWLVEEGASMIRPDRSGARPLLIAAKNSRWGNAREMLRFSDSGAGLPDNHGFLALHYACRDGNEEMIEALAPFESLSSLNVNKESPWDMLPTKELKEKYDPTGAVAAGLESRRAKHAEFASQSGEEVVVPVVAASEEVKPVHSVQGLSTIRKRRIA